MGLFKGKMITESFFLSFHRLLMFVILDMHEICWNVFFTPPLVKKTIFPRVIRDSFKDWFFNRKIVEGGEGSCGNSWNKYPWHAGPRGEPVQLYLFSQQQHLQNIRDGGEHGQGVWRKGESLIQTDVLSTLLFVRSF